MLAAEDSNELERWMDVLQRETSKQNCTPGKYLTFFVTISQLNDIKPDRLPHGWSPTSLCLAAGRSSSRSRVFAN